MRAKAFKKNKLRSQYIRANKELGALMWGWTFIKDPDHQALYEALKGGKISPLVFTSKNSTIREIGRCLLVRRNIKQKLEQMGD